MGSELERIIEESAEIRQELDAAEDEFTRYRLQKQYRRLEMQAKHLGMTKERFQSRIRNQAPKVVQLADYRTGFPATS